MTTIDDADVSNPAGRLARAATLLDAVARASEHTVDHDVPLRCGRAAGRLHAALGFTPAQLPFVGDDAYGIAAAVREALTLLCALPDKDLTDPVLDAILDTRAAAAALPPQAVR